MTCAPAYLAGLATLPLLVVVIVAALIGLLIWRIQRRT
jgi:uncharacterized integral membrane protein